MKIRLCRKHENYVFKLDEHANMNKILLGLNKIIPIQYHDKVDSTKTHCSICYMGKEYRDRLRKLVLSMKK